jgi:hypothetical protein
MHALRGRSKVGDLGCGERSDVAPAAHLRQAQVGERVVLDEAVVHRVVEHRAHRCMSGRVLARPGARGLARDAAQRSVPELLSDRLHRRAAVTPLAATRGCASLRERAHLFASICKELCVPVRTPSLGCVTGTIMGAAGFEPATSRV